MWRPMPLALGWALTDLKELVSALPSHVSAPRLECLRIFVVCPHPDSAISSTTSIATDTSADTAVTTGTLSVPLPPRYAYAAACLDALSGKLVVGGRIRSISESEVDGATALVEGGNSDTAIAAKDVSNSLAAASGESGGLIICATALNVCRFAGRYIHIIRTMPALAPDGLRALRGMLNIYLYLVFACFHTGPAVGTAAFDEVDSGPPHCDHLLHLSAHDPSSLSSVPLLSCASVAASTCILMPLSKMSCICPHIQTEEAPRPILIDLSSISCASTGVSPSALRKSLRELHAIVVRGDQGVGLTSSNTVSRESDPTADLMVCVRRHARVPHHTAHLIVNSVCFVPGRRAQHRSGHQRPALTRTARGAANVCAHARCCGDGIIAEHCGASRLTQAAHCCSTLCE